MGPPRTLPAPPFRPKVPYIHAGPLGEGGPVVDVDDGFAIAETDDLATAVLLEDREVPLGRTVRLIVPKGAEVVDPLRPTGQDGPRRPGGPTPALSPAAPRPAGACHPR